ncbi:MAG TPA: efflux transporter outer membrane subunit [Nitrospirales bacterium]|nr:efflux transporter outer membrane subunit [Nitrospirales bacterium]
MIVKRPVFLMFLILCLPGCLVGPDYQQPVLNVPEDWNSMTLEGAPSQLPITIGQVPEAGWWRSFGNDELNDLIEQALDRNHDLRKAAFRVQEARAIAYGSGAGLYPNLSLKGDYSRIRRSETILVAPTGGTPEGFAPPGANFDIWRGALDLRWELDLWGRIRRGQEAFSAEALGSEMNRRGLLLSLVGEVGQSYFRLRELDEQIEIAERNLALQQDSLSIIRSRAQAGLVSDLDVKREETLVAQTASEIPEFRRQRAVQLHQLEVLTGANPGTLLLSAKPLRSVVVHPTIPVGLPSDLLQRRPDILEIEETLKAANARIGEARAYFFPSLSITGTGGFLTSEFDQWFKWGSRNMTIGPAVTLPIFEGYTNLARLEVAENRYQQMLEDYHQTILNAFREVADVLVALQTRKEQLVNQRQQVAAARESLELADIRYRKGLVTYVDVIDAQRILLTAELGVVQTERARLTAMVDLFKAVGGGWEQENLAQVKPQ